jgi:hypothetical protein
MLILDADQVELLIQQATEYACGRNLDVDQYLQGMFEPMLQDGLMLDLAGMVECLLRYHYDWLRKA